MLVEESGGTVVPSGPAPRRAYWPVALLLGGVVLAILGAAFVLDQRLRPSVGVEPAPAIVAPTQPAAAAPAAATAAPVSLRPTTAPTAPATSTAISATAPSALPTIAPPATAAAVATRPPPKSAAELLSPLQKEIVDGYLRYWAVRSQAFHDADPTRLSEVLAEPELSRDIEDIRRLREQGRAADLDVDLNFRVLKAAPDQATIYDEYVNRSVYLDGATKQVLETKDPPTVLKISFEMRRIGGVWKVVDVARHG